MSPALYSQYASGTQWSAGPTVGSTLGVSGANAIVDRLNSITTDDNLVIGSVISGTSTIINGSSINNVNQETLFVSGIAVGSAANPQVVATILVPTDVNITPDEELIIEINPFSSTGASSGSIWVVFSGTSNGTAAQNTSTPARYYGVNESAATVIRAVQSDGAGEAAVRNIISELTLQSVGSILNFAKTNSMNFQQNGSILIMADNNNDIFKLFGTVKAFKNRI